MRRHDGGRRRGEADGHDDRDGDGRVGVARDRGTGIPSGMGGSSAVLTSKQKGLGSASPSRSSRRARRPPVGHQQRRRGGADVPRPSRSRRVAGGRGPRPGYFGERPRGRNSCLGGERGRTPEELPHGFPVTPIQPLSHLGAERAGTPTLTRPRGPHNDTEIAFPGTRLGYPRNQGSAGRGSRPCATRDAQPRQAQGSNGPAILGCAAGQPGFTSGGPPHPGLPSPRTEMASDL